MFRKLFAWGRGDQAAAAKIPARAPAPVPKPVPARYAPGTEITYHPDLIPRFKGHHASLLKLFKAIHTCASNDDFANAQKALRQFRNVLGEHLLEENIKLYTYIAKCVAEDAHSSELMSNMKAEMGETGTVVMRFVRHYGEYGIVADTKRKFLEELDVIGAALVDRIEREENSLYTMYLPPGSFGG